MKVYKFMRDFIFFLLLVFIAGGIIFIGKMAVIIDSNIVYVNHKVSRPESRDKLPVDTPENPTYVKTSLTNEDIDHIEEILPPLSYDYEIWNMENETLIDSGHYDYPEDAENGYVFIPQHATMANRVVKSSSIEDGMIYTDTEVTLQDDTVISVLYIHDPETLFVRAITVENGNEITYYRNFLYNADIE